MAGRTLVIAKGTVMVIPDDGGRVRQLCPSAVVLFVALCGMRT